MPKKWNSVPTTIANYRIPRAILDASIQALRDGSAGRREWVILWQGAVLDEFTAVVRQMHVPRQLTGPLHFNIPLDERLRLVDVVAASGEFIFAQLHTHPRAAFHSPVDDRLAIPKHAGAISIVVADFGRFWTGDLTESSVNRHMGAGQWQELSSADIHALFTVI